MTTAITKSAVLPLSQAAPAQWPTIDVEPIGPEAQGGREPRLVRIDTLEPGESVTLRNSYHDTTSRCVVNKHGRISARVYRRVCRELCEAEKTRDQCKCEGPHGDPDFVLVPLGGDLSRCEWQICRRPEPRPPSRFKLATTAVGRFTFLTALPYAVAVTWVLGGVALRRLPRVAWFAFKLMAFGTTLFVVIYLAWLLHMAATG